MITYPIISLGQAQQPLATTPPVSSFMTNPRGVIDSQIANIEDTIAQKLKDQTVRSLLIGGSFGLIIGLVLCPIGQSLMGYTVVKKSDLGPQDFA